uniref:WAP domain-containing protein n=1 Tax=Felis catus TaxID=9685 RepID=A0ABI7VVN3_FELCA
MENPNTHPAPGFTLNDLAPAPSNVAAFRGLLGPGGFNSLSQMPFQQWNRSSPCGPRSSRTPLCFWGFALPTRALPGLRDPQLRHHETSPGGPRCCVYHFPAATRAFNFERPCYLRGGICLKQGTPDCEPFRGPCRAFTVCCKVKGLWGRAAAEKP